MGQTCGKCSRVNPEGAYYCYHDGHILDHHARNGGPVTAGHSPFPSAFVLPSGRSCRNFDELAVACNEDWSEAKRLIEEGFLEKFLGGLGRLDLAQAAREAAQFPDRDRGLDQFLTRLPSHALDEPRLRVEPRDVSLGVVLVGQDREFKLVLENQGMRLLYGSVTVDDCSWMALGDAPGATQKLFQFGRDLVIPVHVKGKQLRANARPQEGRLIVESNGGTVTVVIKVEVPVKPFPDGGPLVGATSPRQAAEKAKAKPKESAVYFEKGAVAQWYKANGWTYPVRGPRSTGLGAVQQFFEALGLTPPPKVQVIPSSVALSGVVGANLKHDLEVSTPEKRPVYAHGVSNEPWLEVGRARLNGRTATIPLAVPSVPNRPGETLKAQVAVTSNGNQRFVIPVTLTVGESFDFSGDTVPAVAPVTVAPVAEAAPATAEPVAVAPPAPAPAVPKPAAPKPSGRPPRPRAGGLGWLVHAVPAGLLLLALLGVVALDVFKPGPSGPAGGRRWPDLLDTDPRIKVNFTKDTLRFGVVMTKARDEKNPDRFKRLTREEDGSTNNTCVKIDGFEFLIGTTGSSLGRWGKRRLPPQFEPPWSMTFQTPLDVTVTQTVDVIPGEQTRVLDTCLVRYTVENTSGSPRTVGLRAMLDTFIGSNDGAPFVVPGEGLVNTMKVLNKDIPNYLQVLERPDLTNPGTVVHLGLQGFDVPGLDQTLEPVEKVLLCRWPTDGKVVKWAWEPAPMNQPENDPDSCVALYWSVQKMNPGEKREMAFTYGLNVLSSESSGNARLSLTVGGSFRPRGAFTVTAYVRDAKADQEVTLRVPDGLELLPDQDAVKKITQDGDVGQVSWQLRSKRAGDFTLEALTAGARETYPVKVRDVSLLK